MARPYSDELRERVAGSVASGGSCRERARLFGVSVASVVKWSRRHRATGSAAARPMGGACKGSGDAQHRWKAGGGGKRRPVLAAERAWLLARLEEQPELTVRTLAAELAERGLAVSHNTVWVLRRAGHSFKENAVRHRAGPAGGRQAAAQWKKYQGRLDPGRLVFVDESRA